MDEKKQIEEMAKVIDEVDEHIITGITDYIIKCKLVPIKVATKLYNEGYRKQSRGEWKQAYNSFPRYVCTNCNHLFNNKTFKYCPNCGARMKGE